MGTKPVGHQRKRAHVNNPTQRHGGNRGLNIQQVIEGIETRCEEKQDKTHGKMKNEKEKENKKWIDDG